VTEQTTVAVLIPTPLRRFTNGESRVSGAGTTIAELLDNLDVAYPGLTERVREDDGQIRRFVNIFVNGANIRQLDGADTTLKSGDEVGIIPAMAGGSGR
jgi:molybdopterin synthase sulfur carrier subunit